MIDLTGGTTGYIAHFIDTTERSNLEIQFSQSQKTQAVGQLAGGIAHDFNNLLTAMIGFSDLLLLRHRPGDQSFADIMQIKQNANRAANLVRQLLAFSRQQTLQPRMLDVTDILVELSHLLRRLIGENIELDMVHGRDLAAVKADQGQLEQVIINLAVNARDAMSGGGKLAIRTSNVLVQHARKLRDEEMPPGDYVMIEVEDNGSGIAREVRDRIFDPFFSTKAVGQGTGLGLSTVYGIVKQTGGFIDLETEAGRGTTFMIYLPQFESAPQRAAAAPDGEAETKGARDLTGVETILLVEDEDAVRLFSARVLRSKGYEVHEANSGEAALQLIEDRLDSIDLLITDVVMPHMDGPSLVRRVRKVRPKLKVIFISGYTEDAFRKRLGEDGGIEFLPKPFSLKQLAAKVKEVLGEEGADEVTAGSPPARTVSGMGRAPRP
jgi:two-component system cell cycle sensor histidine kinase/response regulator CckA